MTLYDLQGHLRATGRYSGALDGLWGRLTEAGVLLLLSDGPDTVLSDEDLRSAAKRQGLTFAQVKAVTAVESSGAGFFAGRPLILPEPHRFSKATKGRFDKTDPDVSYPKWGTKPYPKTQDGRYDQLLHMIRLDVDAGFASASYGRFQIMGENHASCGYSTPMAFAEAMARDEVHQLLAFETFLVVTGLLGKLRACTADPETCRSFCKGYNGSAYQANNYHTKLAAAIKRYS
ncbi:MAG: N-acetylmuramidase family protein [Asticcacaulis sp.]|uniref:N-acetylmuramidase family protein n=1 Tax=Asticcacaulis sp. TaxID=1872648 RepID=UPI0039E6DD81